jgi:hypothetical protein
MPFLRLEEYAPFLHKDHGTVYHHISIRHNSIVKDVIITNKPNAPAYTGQKKDQLWIRVISSTLTWKIGLTGEQDLVDLWKVLVSGAPEDILFLNHTNLHRHYTSFGQLYWSSSVDEGLHIPHNHHCTEDCQCSGLYGVWFIEPKFKPVKKPFLVLLSFGRNFKWFIKSFRRNK